MGSAPKQIPSTSIAADVMISSMTHSSLLKEGAREELQVPPSGSRPAPVLSMSSQQEHSDVNSEPDMSPALRHNKFYFDDGNVTFLVEDTLYRVHRSLFTRHSKLFVDEFFPDESEDGADTLQGNTIPIALDECCTCVVLYEIITRTYRSFRKHDVEGVSGWATVLHLATRWGFDSIRELAITSLTPIASPIDKVVFGHRYQVENWLMPGYTNLCARKESLTMDESRRLGLANVVMIANARQEIQRMSFMATANVCPWCNTTDAYSHRDFYGCSNVPVATCRSCSKPHPAELSLTEQSQMVKYLIPQSSLVKWDTPGGASYEEKEGTAIDDGVKAGGPSTGRSSDQPTVWVHGNETDENGPQVVSKIVEMKNGKGRAKGKGKKNGKGRAKEEEKGKKNGKGRAKGKGKKK
ncbi:hypothetical protein EW146_g57 [Bondarzewia mesenterica]|uniref:BTB domain-containing protein n=1 Tax=Bondarzewia mesenterica TaxID=1095465 RepID=A0A4S4MAH5_9AGAM|nr:hypothetical protein EW146_g57 [Bondarzewia mesenterica]